MADLVVYEPTSFLFVDAKVATSGCFLRNTLGKNDSHCGRSKDGYRRCAEK